MKGEIMEFEVFGYKISIEKKALKDETIPKELKEALEIIERYGAKLPPSEKKIASAKRASEMKANKAKEKVINAINSLHLDGEEITAYKIAKRAGVSYNTAKKYFKTIQE
jgi:Fic family protein